MKKNQECHIFICDPNQIMSLISVSLFHVLVYSVYIKQSNVEEFSCKTIVCIKSKLKYFNVCLIFKLRIIDMSQCIIFFIYIYQAFALHLAFFLDNMVLKLKLVLFFFSRLHFGFTRIGFDPKSKA